jgi:hypothetical protein
VTAPGFLAGRSIDLPGYRAWTRRTAARNARRMRLCIPVGATPVNRLRYAYEVAVRCATGTVAVNCAFALGLGGFDLACYLYFDRVVDYAMRVL